MKKAWMKALIPFLAIPMFGCAGTLGVREGGFNLISLEQEWEMRDDFQRQVAEEMTVIRDRQALAYLNRLGGDIVAQTDLAGLRWDFGIIRDDSVNAFNLPGGLVYVHTGLIAEAESLDQLVGVLAHETAHGTARHGTQLMTRAYGFDIISTIVLGRNPSQSKQILAALVGSGVLLDYSRDAERESDRLGVGYMHRAGYDPNGMADFFRNLLEIRKRKPSHVERFFSSHPISEERIRNVETEIKSRGAQGDLMHDTAEFQRFRARFRRP